MRRAVDMRPLYRAAAFPFSSGSAMIPGVMGASDTGNGPSADRSQVRCLVVDDHAAVREGVKMILTRDREISVIGESGIRRRRRRDGRQAPPRRDRHGRPHGRHGRVRGDAQDHRRAPRHRRDPVHGARRARPPRRGARLRRPRATCSRTRRRTTSCARSSAWPRAARTSTRRSRPSWSRRRRRSGCPALSGREREILGLLANGYSNPEIAQRLFISPETVRTHVRNAMTKLEADTRTQAVALALRYEFID